MSDNFTEATRESWGSRLMGSIKGVSFGFILSIAGIMLLFWNEGRAVKTYKGLKEGKGVVISLNSSKVDPKNDGKLIHLTGELSAEGELKENFLDYQLSNTIALQRKVEMFQWKEETRSETKKNLGGSQETVTTYEYKKTWSEIPIKSDNFKKKGYDNPSESQWACISQTFYVDKIKVGDFVLSENLKKGLSNFEKVNLSNEWIKNAKHENLNVTEGYIYIKKNKKSKEDEIGDIRVSYSILKPQTVSIVAVQRGSSFEPYQPKTGPQIEMIKMGIHTAEQMFQAAIQGNKTLTWILRVVGSFLVMFGIGLVFKPLVVVADVVPFLGNILQAGVGIFSFVIGGGISFIVIAIAWFYYRPILSISLIAISVLLYFLFRRKRKTAA
ncbi:MAG: TMEM43 family protein [Bacteroidia bacterium]|nr:TMEM43 family protein [Bacteroidia bacterium]MDW8347377.1 TMEM43 family protein [Bacteroidia bacterium]